MVFNYGRNEVRSFLASSAEHWLSAYHFDALRFDAVASMIYRDYSRKEGQWIPNVHGGRENLEAIAFLRDLNTGIYLDHPDVQTIAEESTAWPGVSRPADWGGLGFGYKWDMGWMHDTLAYFEHDPVHRRWHQSELTFRSVYAFTENFVLPLSHDEVVHGKSSLLGKMPGDEWQSFANLRLLLGYQYTTPGKKLLFMGSEFAQNAEWNHEASLDWHLMDRPFHAGIYRWVRDLDHAYRQSAALHKHDCDPSGFEISMADPDSGLLCYMRRGAGDDLALVLCNFTPVPRFAVELEVPSVGFWQEILNSDAIDYGGSGIGNLGGVRSEPLAEAPQAIVRLTAPPLGCVVMRRTSPQ